MTPVITIEKLAEWLDEEARKKVLLQENKMYVHNAENMARLQGFIHCLIAIQNKIYGKLDEKKS